MRFLGYIRFMAILLISMDIGKIPDLNDMYIIGSEVHFRDQCGVLISVP
jgi:hypothetical protein